MSAAPAPAHIAIVEDEHSLREDLSEYLARRAFAVSAYASAEAFCSAFESHPCDLIVLDIGLPGRSGMEVARWVRQRSLAGIVMLTAFKQAHDQVAGLCAGADAYLIKTTPLEVIEATVHSVLRRMASGEPARLTASAEQRRSLAVDAGPWCLWPHQWTLQLPSGERVSLTHTEVVFLRPLMQAAGAPVTRQALLQALGKPETVSNERNLENYASRLRRKVMAQGGLDIPIRSSYNQGYTFLAPAQVREP